MKYIYIDFLILFICIASCNSNNRSIESYGPSSGPETFNTRDNEYADGTYCAEVEYYYSETGTNSKYVLHVEIENEELTKIYWPNGGWLDESHFTAPDISSGRATFTSDAGVDYTIRILGQGDDCNVSSYAEDEDDLLQDQDDKEEEQNQLQEDSDRSQEEMEEDESSQNEEEPD